MTYLPAKKNHILLLLFALPFLMGTNIDLYVPSLPMITDYYHTSSSLSQLTIGAYMLSGGIGMLLGVVSDTVGRKKILLFASLFYTLISFACPFAPNIYVLILCRFLQGIGTAGMGVAIRAIAIDCFSDLHLNKALNYVSIGWSIGPIVGPLIGGYLQHYFNWQADFYFFAFYGLVMFIIIAMVIPETHINRHAWQPQKMLKNLQTIITNPVFFLTATIAAIIYALLVIFNVVGPFLIQTTLKYSVITYGHIALLVGCAYFSGNILNRILINHFNPIRIAFLAIVLALLINFVMLALGVLGIINLYVVIVPIWLIFFFCGLIFPNMMGKFSSLFPKSGGTASAASGILVTSWVCILSSLATLLKTHSQIPIALMYGSLLLCCLGLLRWSRKL